MPEESGAGVMSKTVEAPLGGLLVNMANGLFASIAAIRAVLVRIVLQPGPALNGPPSPNSHWAFTCTELPLLSSLKAVVVSQLAQTPLHLKGQWASLNNIPQPLNIDESKGNMMNNLTGTVP